MPIFRFTDHSAIVTGGGSGIGRAVVLGLAAEGARVAVVGRRREALEEVAQEAEARGLGGEVRAVPADVTDASEVESAVADAVGAFGGIDVLVNNAGAVPDWSPIHETSLESWNRALEVNLTGVFLMTRAALPHLVERRGAIVNVSSISALKAMHSVASYSAAKAGVLAFTRCVAAEYGWQGLRCNCVVPSWVETAMTAAFLEDEQARGSVAGRHALQRVGSAEEVARVVLHLASDEASFVTGMEYLVDGGMRAL